MPTRTALHRKKPTFRACGRHVEQALGDIPASQRCSCAPEPQQPHARRPFGRR
ncbi:hypothetical protein ACWEHA_11690 [Amycolatopsis nivea]